MYLLNIKLTKYPKSNESKKEYRLLFYQQETSLQSKMSNVKSKFINSRSDKG